MDIRFLALATAMTQPAAKSSVSPWDWEASCTMPNLGVVSAFAAAVSWLASKFNHSTVQALRAARA